MYILDVSVLYYVLYIKNNLSYTRLIMFREQSYKLQCTKVVIENKYFLVQPLILTYYNMFNYILIYNACL